MYTLDVQCSLCSQAKKPSIGNNHVALSSLDPHCTGIHETPRTHVVGIRQRELFAAQFLRACCRPTQSVSQAARACNFQTCRVNFLGILQTSSTLDAREYSKYLSLALLLPLSLYISFHEFSMLPQTSHKFWWKKNHALSPSNAALIFYFFQQHTSS